ncbi:MAG: hypothetical protein KDB51_12025, partial [Propionibacteriaceae bacterium]|nr:hypothetical protein [Propionibacteriaceae bacterium]
MRASDRLGLALMVALWLSLTALEPVTADRRLFLEALAMIAIVCVAGIATRRLLPTDRGARLIQALIALVSLVALAMLEGVSTNPFGIPDLLTNALRWTVESTAPMPPNVAVRMVAVTAVT